ncbi:MAG: arginine repressor [Clostridia bacterium]|jgi:transcriptional regulator of arginine metabolism|nr:arginine repressor [Clostridia bacterium]
MKNIRQQKILELIEKYEIETQEELVERLDNEGVIAAQATVSRDIKELNLIKVAGSRGQYKYAAHVSGRVHASNYSKGLSGAIMKIDYAVNLVVIKTIPGMANAVGAYVDGLGMSGLLGSIAGDDTVLVVTRNEKIAETFGEKLIRLLNTI